jgi:hypothetical protein
VFDNNAELIGIRHVHIELLRDESSRIADVYLELDVIGDCDSRT